MALSYTDWINFQYRNYPSSSEKYFYTKGILNWSDFFYERDPLGTNAKLGRKTKQWGDDKLEIEYRFIGRFTKFKRKYDEYFSITGLIDYNYFNIVKDEFVKSFPQKDRITGVKYFDTMLNELIQEYESVQSNSIKNNSLNLENPHPQIFPNGNCWQLFKYWKEDTKDSKADLCFIYWQMIDDNLMYKITPTQYTDWLIDKLHFDFNGYWKQLYRVDKADRKRLYSMAKLQFNLNKSQF